MSIKNHSQPSLFIFLLLVSVVIILSGILNIFAGLFNYILCGAVIWLVCWRDASFIRTIFLWYIVVLLDKPELICRD